MLSYFGFGFVNYISGEGQEFGGTGYFYAGNEVGVALLIACGAMLIVFNRRFSIVMFTIATTLVSGVLVSSKASILGAAIMTLSFVYFYNLILFGFFAGGSVVIAISQLTKIIDYFELAINRWEHFIELNGWADFLLGGNKRVEYIATYLDYMYSKPFLLFIGAGWTGIAENNFFDILEAFGLFGLLLMLLWAKWLLLPLLKMFSYRGDRLSVAAFRAGALSAALIFFVSIISGHTIQSSLIVPLLGIVCLSYKIAPQKLKA